MSKVYDLRFEHPASHIFCGPSGSGKTVRACTILQHKNSLIKNGEKIKNVVFCYAIWQTYYNDIKRENTVTRWIGKMPSLQEFQDLVEPYKNKGGSIVVIDDFMKDIGPDMDEIVRVTSRHNNTSIFLLFQNLFPRHPLARQISLNVKYIHLHMNPRENNQIYTLARQMDPTSSKWIVESFNHATSQKPYSALLLDLTQACPHHLRVRASYLPHESPLVVYMSKDTFHSTNLLIDEARNGTTTV